MCCFSSAVEKVSDTSIFARARGDRQVIVYSMSFAAKNELAMVLPIPTPPGAPADAVRFISLENCADFFVQLRHGFPARYVNDEVGAFLGDVDAPERVETLKVHDVGSYEATFVPRPEDFARLDERFRLPVQIWLELGTYRDWGFAVFKLKPTALAKVHPMAFEFPRRDRKRLFFPTLHLHGNHLDRMADFDHTLYCQPEPAMNWHLQDWEDSADAAGKFVVCPEAARLVDLESACWRMFIDGMRDNRDTWLP